MRVEKSRFTRSNFVQFFLLLVLCLNSINRGDAAEYGINLDLGVIYTDNLFLLQEGFEESDLVYLISPEFFYIREDDRLVADLRYKPEALFFKEFSENDNVFHLLDASMTAMLVPNRFYIDLQAANFQTIVTPNGQFPTTNIPVTSNRVDSRTLEVKPFWTERIGSADMLAEFGYRFIDYDDPTFQSSNETNALFRLDNVAREQGLTWGIEYRQRDVDYEIADSWEFQRAAAQLGLWVSNVARVFVTGGAESSFENLSESNLDEGFWEAGIQYKPNQRVNMEAAFGQRSYGDSYRAEISMVSRRNEISFFYFDGPESRASIAFERDPIADDDNFGNALDRPGDSDRFITRRSELRVITTLAKTETSLRLFAEKRFLRTTADGIPLDDEEYAGIVFRSEWQATSKSTLGLGADFVRRDDELGNDDITRLQLDYTYALSQRTRLSLEAANSRQRGKVSSEFDYDENQIRLLFRIII